MCNIRNQQLFKDISAIRRENLPLHLNYLIVYLIWKTKDKSVDVGKKSDEMRSWKECACWQELLPTYLSGVGESKMTCEKTALKYGLRPINITTQNKLCIHQSLGDISRMWIAKAVYHSPLYSCVAGLYFITCNVLSLSFITSYNKNGLLCYRWMQLPLFFIYVYLPVLDWNIQFGT